MTAILLVGDRIHPLVEQLERDDGIGISLEWVRTMEDAFSKLAFESYTHVIMGDHHPSHELRSLLQRVTSVNSHSPVVVLVDFDDESVFDETFAAAPNVEYIRAANTDQVKTRVRSLLFEHSFDETVHRERRLQTTLYGAAHQLLTTTDRKRFESSLCQHLIESGLYTVSWISQYNDATDTLVPTAAAGIDPAALACRPIPLGVTSEPEPTAFVTDATDGSNTIAVSLARNGTFYGLLSLVSAADVSPTERELLATFGESLATDLERRERQYTDTLTLETFCQAVTHEFRNHLQTANAYVALGSDTEDEDADTEEEDATAEKLCATLDRMSHLTDQIRELGNAELDDDSLEQRALAETAESAWEHVQHTHGGHDIDHGELDVVESTDIAANHLLLEVLFENLFRNSLDHGDQPTVRVGVLDDGFYVADDGPGIAPSLGDQVFEWGFTTTDTGTGIGLSIVNYIAAAHEWDVTISDEPADGVRFDFTGVTLETDEE